MTQTTDESVARARHAERAAQRQVEQAADVTRRLWAAAWEGDTDTMQSLTAGLDWRGVRVVLNLLAVCAGPPPDDLNRVLNGRIKAARHAEISDQRRRRDLIAVRREAETAGVAP